MRPDTKAAGDRACRRGSDSKPYFIRHFNGFCRPTLCATTYGQPFAHLDMTTAMATNKAHPEGRSPYH